ESGRGYTRRKPSTSVGGFRVFRLTRGRHRRLHLVRGGDNSPYGRIGSASKEEPHRRRCSPVHAPRTAHHTAWTSKKPASRSTPTCRPSDSPRHTSRCRGTERPAGCGRRRVAPGEGPPPRRAGPVPTVRRTGRG